LTARTGQNADSAHPDAGPAQGDQTQPPAGIHAAQDLKPSTRHEGDGLPEAPSEAAVALPHTLQVLGSVVAPTTLITGLFFYFGLLYAISYYRYFGVNYSLLDLPFTGVLVLSAQTAILPLAVLAGTVLLVLWVYHLPVTPSSRAVRRGLVWGLLPLVALCGALLVGLAVADAVFGASVFGNFYEGRGLSLSIGMVLLGYAGRLRRALLPARTCNSGPLALAVARWACLCSLFGVGLFWAVGSYALRTGDHDARAFAAHLTCAPDLILYSEHSLNLESAGLQEEHISGADQGYAFRYSGLKSVPEPGSKYLLLPADWAPAARPSILLPRSDSLRLEFVTVQQSRTAFC
jgi:hypothetical protein